MEQLRVLGVEPDGQVERVDVVDRPHLVVLDEAGGEGGVVPGGVRQVHADIEPGLGRHRPMHGDQEGGQREERRGEGRIGEPE